MLRKLDVLFYILIIVMISCTLDYKKSRVAENLSEKIPDKIFYNFEYKKVNGTVPEIILKAGKAEIYSSKEETFLEKVQFLEYDKSGKIVTEGTADKALVYTKTDSIELQGNLRLFSSENDAVINSEYIFWDSEKKEIRGKEDSYVKIIKSSGSFLEGKGFKADTRLLSLSFSSEVKGLHVSESKK